MFNKELWQDTEAYRILNNYTDGVDSDELVKLMSACERGYYKCWIDGSCESLRKVAEGHLPLRRIGVQRREIISKAIRYHKVVSLWKIKRMA